MEEEMKLNPDERASLMRLKEGIDTYLRKLAPSTKTKNRKVKN